MAYMSLYECDVKVLYGCDLLTWLILYACDGHITIFCLYVMDIVL